MADNVVKASLELDLTKLDKEKVIEQVADAIEQGVEKGSNQKFDFKSIKKDLTKSMGQGFDAIWKNSGKVQEKQKTASVKYLAAQKGVANVINSQSNGFTKSLKLVGAISKQGMAGAAFMADQFTRIAKESSKFVGQGSIFTDKSTMQMMQLTGQTGTQAQATQRSLSMTGLDFSDIQSGKITSEQAALFEQLRLRELEKLEEINALAGPMFKSFQQITLGFTLLMQDINDFITVTFSKNTGIENLVGSLKTFMERVDPFMKGLIRALDPVVSVVGDIIAFALDIVSAVMPLITGILNALDPVFNIIAKIVSIIKRVLSPILLAIGDMFGLLGAALEFVFGFLDPIVDFFDWLVDALEPFGKWFDKIMGNNLKGIEKDWGTETGIGSGYTNSTANYENQVTNNYIYGSQSMSQANPRQNNNDLFSNSYVLVND